MQLFAFVGRNTPLLDTNRYAYFFLIVDTYDFRICAIMVFISRPSHPFLTMPTFLHPAEFVPVGVPFLARRLGRCGGSGAEASYCRYQALDAAHQERHLLRRGTEGGGKGEWGMGKDLCPRVSVLECRLQVSRKMASWLDL